MRRLIIDGIRTDPDWNNGNYTAQPHSAKLVSVFYNIATNGGTLGYQKCTHARSCRQTGQRPPSRAFTADANDVLLPMGLFALITAS